MQHCFSATAERNSNAQRRADDSSKAGRIEGGLDANSELAVAVNGTIAATTRSYEDSGETRFARLSMLLKFRRDSLRSFQNVVQVLRRSLTRSTVN